MARPIRNHRGDVYDLVNGSAVLRFAPALRVTPLARCGTEALTGRKDTFPAH